MSIAKRLTEAGTIKEFFAVKGSPKGFVSTSSSGKDAIRHSYPDCGSLLFGTPELDNGLVTIYAGSIDCNFVSNPSIVINAKSKVNWIKFEDEITTFDNLL